MATSLSAGPVGVVRLVDATVARGGRTILDRVSVEFAPASLTVVTGGNGSGKSTLLGASLGLLKLQGGRLDAAKSASYLTERFRPPGSMRPTSYLRWVARARGLRRTQTQEQMAEIAARLEFPIWTDDRLRDLSKGNLQKVGLIAALIGKPHFVVLDEPLSGLDDESAMSAGNLITDQARNGAAVLLVHHGAPSYFPGARALGMQSGHLHAVNEARSSLVRLWARRSSGSDREAPELPSHVTAIIVGDRMSVTFLDRDLARLLGTISQAGWSIDEVEGA